MVIRGVNTSGNHIVGITNWHEVCRLARKLTNCGQYFNSGLSRTPRIHKIVYADLDLLPIANDSIGGREWEVLGEPVKTAPSFDGEFLFFTEEQVKTVLFQSGTSGATIIVSPTRHDPKKWIIRFHGTTYSGRAESLLPADARESDYARRYMSLDFISIKIKNLPYPGLLAKALR